MTEEELSAEEVAEEEEEEKHTDQAYGAGGSADLKMKWDTEKSWRIFIVQRNLSFSSRV